MPYNDYPENYPNQIIEKLNLAYKKQKETDVKVFNNNFFQLHETMLDKTVEIAGETRCELESLLVNLIESLNNCERWLNNIKLADKNNKKNLTNLIEITQKNKVEIANCCNNQYDIECDYYATTCPRNNFSKCCANYCSCEIDVIEQLLFLCLCRGFPFDRSRLLGLMQSRIDCLKSIVHKYALTK